MQLDEECSRQRLKEDKVDLIRRKPNLEKNGIKHAKGNINVPLSLLCDH